MNFTDKAESTELRRAETPAELPAQQTDIEIDQSTFDFETTESIEPLKTIVGQERAMEALDIGLGIGHDGYNIFVSGMTGAGRMKTIRDSIAGKVDGSARPDDWIYVNNFDKPDEPIAISLPAGKGKEFKADMKGVVENLIQNLTKAFRQEDFSQEKQRLGEKYNRLFQEQMEVLANQAKERGFEISPGPQGNIFFIPLIEGKIPENPESLQNLSAEEKNRIQQGQDHLTNQAAKLMQNQHDMLHSLTEEVRQVERRFGENVVTPVINELKARYAQFEKLQKYLDRVAKNVLDNLGDFREGGKKQMPAGPMGMMMQEVAPSFVEYQVNVVVDNSETMRAPIIMEESPSYRNLFGAIDKIVENTGRLVTNFTQIKAGSLLQASGGYLILNLMDALTEPFVYKSLKRALKRGMQEFETFDAWLPFSTGGIKPEPIPIRTKVIVVGNEYLNYMLRFYDEDFATIFKVKAEFGWQMPKERSQQYDYARFISKKVKDENLLHFMRDAVAEVIRYGARKSAEKDKLSTQFSEIADLLRESDYFARKANAPLVSAQHVRDALKSKVYRSDRIAEKIRELIANGTILISTEQSATGQINGLAVYNLGDYMFGKPSRVTVSLGLGAEGVINIEREAKLSGSTHDKGVLILSGYIRNTYGKDKPLALSASLCFEQSYGGIDGDSASAAELFVLLATLAGLPIRQDIAVTGSINQWGQIQAIGAVNEKVEGFFDVCRLMGLTGRQGVCIPASNVRNLVLRDDAREAIRQGQFHIYPISTADQGLELLTGIAAGSAAQEGTLHWLVDQNLRHLAQELKEFGRAGETAHLVSSQQQAPPNVPPRLPEDNP